MYTPDDDSVSRVTNGLLTTNIFNTTGNINIIFWFVSHVQYR